MLRIAIDPVPIVLGIYAQVGELLNRASSRREDDDAEALARRFSSRRGEADRDIQKLVRALHTDVKNADKLLKKTADVWKISQETDLVDLVVQSRGDGEDPQAYVLLQPGDVRALLLAIREAARGSGESQETLNELEKAAAALEGRPREYLAFGFDPWNA